MGKTLFDYMTEEDYARYNEIVDRAMAAKAAAPKAPRQKKPQTKEQKLASMQARIAKYQAKLDALLKGETEDETTEA